MSRKPAVFILAALICASAQAATTSTTVTVNNAAVTLSGGTSGTASGTATFSPGIPDTSGAFAANVALGTAVSGTFTIKLAGGTLAGTISLPASILTATSPVTGGSMVISGSTSTGTYSGASGTIPLTGTGSVSATGLAVSFSGTGSVTTGGTTGGGGGGGGTSTSPAITAVLDGAAYTANIAQGSIFVVKGSNLSGSGVTSYGIPRPTVTTSGVKITFTPTSGGAGTDCYLVYTYNQGGVSQLAAILPSSVSPGSYNVTVTNGTVSAPAVVTVVKAKPGLFTQSTDGTGLATVQNYISASQYDLNRYTVGSVSGTTISPGRPGQVMIAYGTGLGPLVGGDNSASPVFDFSTNGSTIKAIVGGVTLPVIFAGRAGYAGEDQINFTLPSNIPTGCTISFQLSVDGVLSNPTFIAIAPDATSNACVLPGFTTQQLQKFDQGGTYTTGSFSVLSISETVPSFGTLTIGQAAGAFTQFSAYQLAGASAATGVLNTGSCQVIQSTASSATTVTTGGTVLDAGAITLTGPPGSNITNVSLQQDASNLYSATLTSIPGLPGGANGTIVAGTYNLNGAGGKDVGKFTAAVTLGAPLTVTGGLPASVTRNAGLTLNWNGGNASDLVEIFGSSTSSASANATTTSFVCITTAGQKTFTVPASILNQLPATGSTGAGSLTVVSAVNPTSGNGAFSAPLTAGGVIDAGFFLGLTGVGSTPTYQ
ncbi:MAG TPA: hypothetical protein VG456_08495 [Candidatus Sulfopaludibacter sp.]|jgi:uncharacterized protein (TIGR03437 family)|nr:hypothetical protein [Candidatus Sulfopaludibacter sp.]